MKGRNTKSTARVARPRHRVRLSLEPLDERLAPSAVPLFETGDSSFSPFIPVVNDTSPVELGAKFTVTVPGSVGAIQFYRGAPSNSGFAVHLWDDFGNLLATGNAPGNQAPGWQTVNLDQAVSLQTHAIYVASYYTSTGGYAADHNYLVTYAPDRGPLGAAGYVGGESGPPDGIGFYRYGVGGGFPNQTYLKSNYWVGPVFQPATGAAPVVTALSQTSSPTTGGTAMTITGANFKPNAKPPRVYFGTAMAQLTSASANEIAVVIPAHAAVSVDVRVITDAGESDVSTADLFTYTPAPPPSAPITPFETTDSSFAPAIPVANDNTAVELGVRFEARPGRVTAIQFYRGEPSSSGFTVHLWDNLGKLLGSGRAPGNQAAGWQTVNLDFPVLINFGPYVASYFTSGGRYAVDQNFQFQSRGPLVLRSGVFHYGQWGGFPKETYLSSNYWVGPVFQASAGPAPTISALSQTSAPTSGGTQMTITGANFNWGTIAPTVYFGNVKAQVISFSATEIVVVIPPHPPGKVYVRVITDAGQSVIDAAALFEYTM